MEVAIYINAHGESDNPNPEAIFEQITVALGPGAFSRMVIAHGSDDDETPVPISHVAQGLVVWEDGCMVEQRTDVRVVRGEAT